MKDFYRRVRSVGIGVPIPCLGWRDLVLNNKRLSGGTCSNVAVGIVWQVSLVALPCYVGDSELILLRIAVAIIALIARSSPGMTT